MSLTRILKGNSERDTKFKNEINKIVPKRNELKTISNNMPYSNNFKMKVPNLVKGMEQSSITGTAFDYLARFIIAKYIKNPKCKKTALMDLVCYSGIYVLDKKKIDTERINRKLEDIISDIEYFIYSKDTSLETFKKIITHSLYLAKLEEIARGNKRELSNNIIEELLNYDDRDIKNQLYFLCKDFVRVFIDGNILKKHSKVIFNPIFNKCSMLVQGADADLIIDGVLYDIKTTKFNEYKWQDIAQITGYYLFSEIENLYNIKRIAIYLARYGEIIYFDVENFSCISKEEVIRNIKKIIKYNFV